MKRTILVTIGLGLLAANAFAQAMPTRPTEMGIFEGHIGKWEGTMKWTAPGMEGDMKASVVTEWDGLFLKSTSVMEMQGMKFTENSMTCWDASKKEYQMYTFTNFGATPRIERMKPSTTGTQVWQSDPWDMGMGSLMVSRATLSMKDKNTQVIALEFKEGDKFNRVAEMQLTRVK